MLQRTVPALRLAAGLAAAAGAAALAVALVAQYGFGLRPCVLCLAQRVPFLVASLLGLAALASAAMRARRPLVMLAGLAFLVNTGLAVYHVGVERHWWASPGCSAEGPQTPMTVAELARLAAQPAEVPCDKPAWSWHGVTMAGFNIAYSGGVALIVLALAFRREDRG